MPRFAFDRLSDTDARRSPQSSQDQPSPGNTVAGARVYLDRAAHVRGDADALAEALEHGRVFPIWRGRVLIGDDGAPCDFSHDHAIFGQGSAPIYLGHCAPDGGEDTSQAAREHWFAVDISTWEPESGAPATEVFLDPSETVHPAAPSARFVEMRSHLGALDPRWGERLATARALALWHVSHRFCAACGTQSDIADAGWRRSCGHCGTAHFPRTDPVVIMLVTRGNSVLLGRSPAWPEGMYSCLAGFVEPGETVEAAVAREVLEETGIFVDAVRYVASQPWPFPASLMLGMRAEAVSQEITIDPVEIEDAIWMTREELADVFAGLHPKITAPRNGAIAGYLLRQWLADAPDCGA
ncbi:NAD(+) diphosphatase [Albirhodobacter sp. R86504]|uniref:NAD(+) diphosphatase n=1 Tax=Albirhodobacter sp. R86504 TaxID=3093848 RepID=UPI00366E0D42